MKGTKPIRDAGSGMGARGERYSHAKAAEVAKGHGSLDRINRRDRIIPGQGLSTKLFETAGRFQAHFLYVSVNFGPFRWFSAIFVFFFKKIFGRTATSRTGQRCGRGDVAVGNRWKMVISNWRFQISKKANEKSDAGRANKIKPNRRGRGMTKL